MRNLILICGFLITACGTASTQNASNNSLDPYITTTASFTSTPNIIIPETPLPTATPLIYTIQAGDTFSELAEQFKISQDDLRAANPDVSPNSMTIGTTLLIPNSSNTTVDASIPTPVPAPVTQTVCHPTADNGLWCFALIQNNTSDLLENVSAQLTLLDENNNVLASQAAFMPLDIISPNSSLPVYVFFPNISTNNVEVQVKLLSAVQLSSNTTRYLPVTLNNTVAQIDWNGLTAQLSGQIFLPAESTAATRVWVAAVAYDKNGRVVGVKRWEGGAIQPGENISFSFAVSSIGGDIDAVEFFVQAKP
ncbi:MAG: LysM peptidoglycan-binding domain-containing protein [Anaerolineales bacterium]|nr:LysM peptidoglycan-binding domain-containing protein [Anaerolineales bacterium]